MEGSRWEVGVMGARAPEVVMIAFVRLRCSRREE